MPVFQKNYDFFKKSLDKPLSVVYNVTVIWVWRRLVARYLGVVEAAGSSPVTQTKKYARAKARVYFFVLVP